MPLCLLLLCLSYVCLCHLLRPPLQTVVFVVGFLCLDGCVISVDSMCLVPPLRTAPGSVPAPRGPGPCRPAPEYSPR